MHLLHEVDGEPTLSVAAVLLEFLAGSPSAQEIVGFRPSAMAQRRFSALLALNRERELTEEEEEELDHYMQIRCGEEGLHLQSMFQRRQGRFI